MKKLLIVLKVLVVLCGFAAFKVTAAEVFFEDFESGGGGWYADNGIWEIGTPTAGPADCHEGTGCAGTILDGNYPDHTDSRLISPSIVLPYISNNQEISLQFWHWFSYAAYDRGYVQIKFFDENTAQWSDWEPIDPTHPGFGGYTSPVWTFFSIDISQYSGKKNTICFSSYSRSL